MRNILVVGMLLTAPLLLPQAVNSQGMFESLGVRGAAAGMGAGVAASSNHGRLMTRTYETAAQAQQRALAQTKAIEQYVKLGSAYEARKQWSSAEESFHYVLQVIAQRDGVGSDKALPALKHLVNVTAGAHDFDQAISYQKTVLVFAQAEAAKIPNPVGVIGEQIRLANLYTQKEDYGSAEPLLKASMETVTKSETLPAEKRILVTRTYARILRKLHKDTEANALEAQLGQETSQSDSSNESTDRQIQASALSGGTQTVSGQGQPVAAASAQAQSVAPIEPRVSSTSQTNTSGTASGASRSSNGVTSTPAPADGSSP